MVSSLIACDENGAETHFAVASDNIFVKNEYLTEPALVENIAQSAAARIGYICHQQNKPLPVGFIGAVQNLKIYLLPKIGDMLRTTISIKNQIFNATIIEGNISLNGQRIANCEMKIFISQQN